MKDLFEHYEHQPKELATIVNKHLSRMENEGYSYCHCDEFLQEIRPLGYIFEFDLDARPYNLRKL